MKTNCRPDVSSTSFSETTAQVSLAALLEHTANRLVRIESGRISDYLASQTLESDQLTFICTWGFDGSSGQSLYKQNFSDAASSDSHLFATTVVPLQLVNQTGHIYWENPTPQSIRFCRPLHLSSLKKLQNGSRNKSQPLIKKLQL